MGLEFFWSGFFLANIYIHLSLYLSLSILLSLLFSFTISFFLSDLCLILLVPIVSPYSQGTPLFHLSDGCVYRSGKQVLSNVTSLVVNGDVIFYIDSTFQLHVVNAENCDEVDKSESFVAIFTTFIIYQSVVVNNDPPLRERESLSEQSGTYFY